MHAMDLRLRYDLDRFYGEKYDFVPEGSNVITGGKIVNVGKPYIIPYNPNQKPYLRSVVEVGFLRDDNWEPIVRDEKGVAKGDERDKKKRRRRTRRRDRDRLRQDIGDE